HCGIYHELELEHFIFHFNLNYEIIRTKRKGSPWTHPHEWLKRTIGNDWVYYSTGGYTGVFEATGEYYLPNFKYSTNSVLGGHPFQLKEVHSLAENWHTILTTFREESFFSDTCCSAWNGAPPSLADSIKDIISRDPSYLAQKAQTLFDIIGGRISVLPPDARHVDYNLVPLTISTGCLYKCAFCKVKNRNPFVELGRWEIDRQLDQLRQLYDRDMVNYNSLYLGEHDALQASPKSILYAVEEAIIKLGLTQSNISGNNTFFFGSVASLLGTDTAFFQNLNKLPGNSFINIGLESADQDTLDQIGKPIIAKDVKDAFHRMQEINERFDSIELTANFLMDKSLPPGHYPSTLGLIRDSQPRKKPKGTIYFSPLTFDQPSRSRLFEFNRLKIASRLPTFLYIIQRL
ncbi:MAG: radical SAM domain-containing protein, partial [Desulforhopalus sp.]